MLKNVNNFLKSSKTTKEFVSVFLLFDHNAHTFPRERTRHETVEINVSFNKSLWEVKQVP